MLSLLPRSALVAPASPRVASRASRRGRVPLASRARARARRPTAVVPSEARDDRPARAALGRGSRVTVCAMTIGGVGPAANDDDDEVIDVEASAPSGAEDAASDADVDAPVRQNYVWNAPGWEALVKICYVAVAALICNNILFEFFPYGLGAPARPPAFLSCETGELLVMLSGVLLGAFDFGPQCGKQIRGGLKALDNSIAKQRQAAVDFLGLVLLKIVSDGIGLALLALPALLMPDWLPRSAGIGVALLGRSAFVENCDQTFDVDGVAKTVPQNVRAIIAVFDRTLAFMAISVAYGTFNDAPYVALPSAILFFAGAVYFAFGEKLMRKK